MIQHSSQFESHRVAPGGPVDARNSTLCRSGHPPWRARTTAAGLVLVVASMTACASPAAAPVTSSSPSTTAPTTTFGWLKSVAQPWNEKLNSDQGAVLKDSKPAVNESGSTFFSHLVAACTQMLNDARKAGQIASAPSAALDAAWRRMATEAVTYASDCVTVAKDQSTGALSTWTASLRAMNAANSDFNAAVGTVVPKAKGATSTTSAAAG
jgi:hypothetical protein